MTNKIVNIPNALSVGRAVSGPIISYMIIQGPDVYSSELVLTTIALAGISDYADGYLARRWNQTSNFGSFFDAAADKIFVSSVGVGMAATGQLPAWIVGLFVLRDCGFLASGFWRRANALKFENLTWRQYFAIDTVKREDEREDNGVVEKSGRGESSSSVENSDTSRVAARKERKAIGKRSTPRKSGNRSSSAKSPRRYKWVSSLSRAGKRSTTSRSSSTRTRRKSKSFPPRLKTLPTSPSPPPPTPPRITPKRTSRTPDGKN